MRCCAPHHCPAGSQTAKAALALPRQQRTNHGAARFGEEFEGNPITDLWQIGGGAGLMEEFPGNLGENQSVGCQDFVIVFVFDGDASRLPARLAVGGELGVPGFVPAKMFERRCQDSDHHD